ncbi:MAG: SIMPL domain-containing protein [Bacteroidota bacterium]
MKKVFLALMIFSFALSQAQETKQIPQVTVAGEGKVKVIPDQASISVTVETKGANATEVKKKNDMIVEKAVQFLKKSKLAKEDFQTQRVSLSPQYDYEKKENYYNASQTIEISLKDLSTYDAIMEGLVNAGINRIDKVEFKSSRLAQYQSEARKLAMKEAKLKAEDYVSVLGQKVGKALLISDNTQTYYPQPMYAGAMLKSSMADESAPRQTLAIGEIDIVANVNVSFVLE